MSTRPRSLFRPANFALVIVLAIFVFAAYVVHKAMQPPGRPGTFAAALDAHVLLGQPESGPNGWDLLLAANAARMKVEAELWGDPEQPSRDGLQLDYSVLYGADDSLRRDEDREAKRPELVRRARASLEALDRSGIRDTLDAMAASRRAIRPAPSTALIDWKLPELGQSRATARMLAARMRVAAEAGDLADRARTFEHLLALGRITGRQAFLIDRLIGIAVVHLALDQLSRDLLDFPLPAGSAGAAAAADLAAILDRQIEFRPFADALRGEAFMLRDTIEWACTDDGSGDGWIMPARLGMVQAGTDGLTLGIDRPLTVGERLTTAVGVFHPSKRQMLTSIDRWLERITPLCDTTRPQRLAQPGTDEWLTTELGSRNLLLKLLLPAFGKAMSSDEIIRMKIAGARLMLAIEAHRAAHGQPPDSLEALAAARGITLPIDPVSGKPFGYRRLDAPDQMGRTYLLYSLGDDGLDHGGAEPPPGGQVIRIEALTSAGAHGFDYVINHTDRQAPPR